MSGSRAIQSPFQSNDSGTIALQSTDEFLVIRRVGQTNTVLSFGTADAVIAFMAALLIQSGVADGKKRLAAASEMLAHFATHDMVEQLTK